MFGFKRVPMVSGRNASLNLCSRMNYRKSRMKREKVLNLLIVGSGLIVDIPNA